MNFCRNDTFLLVRDGTFFAHLLSDPMAMERFFKMLALIKYIIILGLLLIALPAGACFGPKLYVATDAGEEGELLFYLVAIYIQEKTGIESTRFEMAPEESGENLLLQDKIDLVFASAANKKWPSLLVVADELFLLSGPRPTDDLQFTTVPKALSRLQSRLKSADLVLLRQQVAKGVLPAKAVRTLYMQRGWI